MKVTKENAVVGLKVVLDKDSQFAYQGENAKYGVIIDKEDYFFSNPNYLWVNVQWYDVNNKALSNYAYRIGDNDEFDLNVYQESTKTLNKDTVKLGQKVRVIADSARELGFEHAFNNQRHPKDYIGTITCVDGTTRYHSEHSWVHLDGASSAICTMLLELVEEPKSELLPKDMISGEWYYVTTTGSSKYWMFKFHSIEKSEIKTTLSTAIDSGSYNGLSTWGNINDVLALRKATQEEVEKYYPNEFKSKEVIPEYVECIKGFNTDLFVNDFNVVGKTYEVKHYNPKTFELKLKGFRGTIASIRFDGNSESLATDYKISTKEAFDAQQNPKENLVGRYLKTLVNNPVSIRMNIGDYLLVTKFNSYGNTYDVTKVKTGGTQFGIEVSDLPKFEVMPVGFNPKVEEPVNKEDDLIAEAQKDIKTGLEQAYIMGAGSSKLSSSPSIDEILHYCKFRYKEGDVVIPLNHRGEADYKEHTLQGEIQKYSNEEIGTGQTPGFLYANGKYAEIVNFSKQEVASKYTRESWSKTPAYSEDYATFVKPKEKYKFSEVEYLLKPINQQLDLPIVKKYKKKSIINL